MKGKITITIVGLAVVAGLGYLIFSTAARVPAPAGATPSTGIVNEAPAAGEQPATSTPTAGTPAVTKALSYQEALHLYSSRRIQISPACQLTPSSAVFKNPASVMFDNRSATTKYFFLNGVRHTLSGYGFEIMTLSSKLLPHIITVDCGSGKNNGKITLD